MKHNFRILIGMLLFAIPLCLSAQDNKELNDLKDKVDRMPKISGFVQGMYQANLTDEGKLMEGDDASTFRMRRVRLSVDGKLTKSLSYKIQGDFTGTPALVDAYVKYKPCNEFAIQVGQFKTPFSIESPINPVNLEIFDYGECISKLVGYKDICGIGKLGRDIGIMASGNFFPMEGKDFSIVTYNVGLFNGNGANALDNNNRKDIVGRLDIHPGLKDLTLSGSYYYGNYKKDNTYQGTRDRWTAGLQYNDGNIVVRAEYFNGLTGYQVASFNDTLPVLDEQGNQVYVEGLRNSKGFYAVAGYNFRLGKDKSQKLMPVLRYEQFEPGDMAPLVFGSTNIYTVGINYWPVKSLNFKLDYSLIQKVVGEKANSHRVVGILSYKF